MKNRELVDRSELSKLVTEYIQRDAYWRAISVELGADGAHLLRGLVPGEGQNDSLVEAVHRILGALTADYAVPRDVVAEVVERAGLISSCQLSDDGRVLGVEIWPHEHRPTDRPLLVESLLAHDCRSEEQLRTSVEAMVQTVRYHQTLDAV